MILRHVPGGTRCCELASDMVLWAGLPAGRPVEARYKQATAVGLCVARGYMVGDHARNLRLRVSRLHSAAQSAIGSLTARLTP